MSEFTVPPEMVGPLRSGLYSGLGFAADAISQITDSAGRERHPEWYRAPLDGLDRVRALLDVLGWEDTQPRVAVRIDLKTHGHALLQALDVAALIALDDALGEPAVDAERARQGKPARQAEPTARIDAIREFFAAVVAHMEKDGLL